MVFSCTETEKKKDNTNSIIEKNEKNDFLTIITQTEIKSPVLIKIDKDFDNLMNYQNILYSKGDTLQIKIQPYELIEVHNKYTYTDTLIVQQGDTLSLSYDSDFLKKEIHNKSKKLVEKANYKKIVDSTFLNYLHSLANKFYVTNYDNPLELENDFSKIRLYALKANQNTIKNEKEVSKLIKKYDSLFTHYMTISNNQFNDSKKNIYQDLFLKKVFDDLITVYKLSKNPELKIYLLSESFINKVLGSHYQYNILRTILLKVLYLNKKDKSRSKTVYSIPEIYSDLPTKISNPTLLKKLRMICLEEMIQQGSSLKDVTELYEKFNSKYADTNFQNYFKAKYLIDLREKYSSSTEFNLLDTNRAIKNFNSLKESLKGNVIYIDFWASWCAPCRKAMPASKKLLNEFYEKENIVFIYISLDENMEAWKNASRVEGIDSYAYSYLILNSNQSKFMHDLKIREIPRYIIFDTSGDLVEDNAPGPSSKKIKETLMKYKRKGNGIN